MANQNDPEPRVYFDNVGTLTNCNAAQITWTTANFTAAGIPLNSSFHLFIARTTLNMFDPGVPFADLAVVQVDDGLYAWTTAQYPGSWTIQGSTEEGVAAQTNSFHIVNGTDTSCLNVIATMTSAQATSTAASSAAPASDLTSGSPSHRTASIVGGVIGAFASLMLAALLFFWYRRRSRRNTRNWPRMPMLMWVHQRDAGIGGPEPKSGFAEIAGERDDFKSPSMLDPFADPVHRS